MISNGQKTSILIPSQLPEFIRDNPDYENFVLFLQAYYEWMELPNTSNSLITTATTQQGVTHASKNLLDYHDIDETINTFTSHFYNEFISYFPNEILADKDKVIKLAKQLYQAKGTPASFQFFFRTLYNTDVDFFYTKDAVLKASAGKWYISKSLKLSSSDLNFLVTNNLRAFGETTKSIATIENSVLSKGKIEVFISDIQRLFQSGEIIRIVDGNNQDVYFKNSAIVSSTTSGATILRAKIVGQISQIKISSSQDRRGLFYEGANTSLNYPGDPVIVYGGLNSIDGVGASATVGETTKGSIKSISVANNQGVLLGGFGYSQPSTTRANSGLITISGTSGATAEIAGVNTATVFVGDSFYNPVSNIAFISTDRIGSKTGGNPSIEEAQYLFDTTKGFELHAGVSLGLVYADHLTYTSLDPVNYSFANTGIALSNATSNLAYSLSFAPAFNTYPISSVVVTNQGGGLKTVPTITAQSLYRSQDTVSKGDLGNLGILGPIKIDTKGTGYLVNDVINIVGGSGYGANAKVTVVAANGAILKADYFYPTTVTRPYPLGGMGYRLGALPTLTVTSASGINAALSVAGIVGQGAAFIAEPDRIGSITSINISDFGEDYIAQPNVSFKVHDIVVTNISPGNSPERGDLIYQGASTTSATYLSTVDSITLILNDLNPTNSLYILRAFNYNSVPNINLPILANNRTYSLTMTNSHETTIKAQYGGINSQRYNNGVITYGDGTATGNATFLNGLTLGAGQYLDSSGQPSSFDVLQSTIYNNYTYEITLEKEIAKYRNALLNLLHPTGMKVIGRYAMKSADSFDVNISDILQSGNTLYHFTANADTTMTLSSNGDFRQLSSNVITISHLPWSGVTLSNFLTTGTTISFTSSANDTFFGVVDTVQQGVANTITLKNNVWLSISNVASGVAACGTNIINISNVYTSSYNVFNNGNYSSNNPLIDIIQVGDFVNISNQVKLVTSINYTTKVLTLSNNFTSSATGNIGVNKVFATNAANIRIVKPNASGYT